MTHVTSLLLGLGNGGVYAALAIAIVLTYRSSGVINFATGAMALYSAYTYSFLRQGRLLIPIPGVPSPVSLGVTLGFVPAVVIALVLSVALGALLYGVVFRPLRHAPPLSRLVASLGVLVVIEGVMVNRVGDAPASVASIFPATRWQPGVRGAAVRSLLPRGDGRCSRRRAFSSVPVDPFRPPRTRRRRQARAPS